MHPIDQQNLRAARKHLIRCLLNQVGCEQDEAEQSAATIESRFRAAGMSIAEIITRLDLEAARYEDM